MTREIITEISRRFRIWLSDISSRSSSKKPIPAFPIHIGRSLYPLSNPIYEQRQAVMLEQNRIIREMAEVKLCD